MLHDRLAQDLYTEICRIPLIDPHSHIDPHRPTARSLDEILGYHYYTELAHSAGMDKAPLAKEVEPRERVRVDERDLADFRVEALGQRIVEHGGSSGATVSRAAAATTPGR